jgi:hypothetical protein
MALRTLALANGFVKDAPRSPPEDVRAVMDDAGEVRVVAPALVNWLQWLVSDVDGAHSAKCWSCPPNRPGITARVRPWDRAAECNAAADGLQLRRL